MRPGRRGGNRLGETMNIAEAELLDRSFARLGNTLLANRSLDQRTRDSELDRAMRGEEFRGRQDLAREELNQRFEDRADMRENRRLGLEAQKAHQERLETIAKEGNATKQTTEYLKFLKELNESGQLTEDGLRVMEDKFNEMIGGTGLGVKIFRQAPPKRAGFNTREGHNLELAESYRERSSAAQRAGDGEAAERFRGIAERLERGGTPEKEDDVSSISQRIMAPNAQFGDEPLATVTRKVPSSRLDEEMQKLRGGTSTRAMEAEAAASTGGQLGGKPPTVTTQAQFDALPKGTKYIGRDGKLYVKP